MIYNIFSIFSVLILIAYLNLSFSFKLNQLTSEFQSLKSELVSLSQDQKSFKPASLKENNHSLLMSILEVDIENYRYIDDSDKTRIINAINTSSKKYDLNPLILYSILYNESRFKVGVKHKPVFIKKLNKSVQAQGLGGIVWEYWGDELIKNTSIKSKQDLSIIEYNIEASAFIIKTYINESDSLDKALSKYYGSTKSNYDLKILNKATKTINNQLLKSSL